MKYLGYALHATDATVAHHVHDTLSSDHGGWGGVVGSNFYQLYSVAEVNQVGTEIAGSWLSHCQDSYTSRASRSRGIRDVVTLAAEYIFPDERPFNTKLDWGTVLVLDSPIPLPGFAPTAAPA